MISKKMIKCLEGIRRSGKINMHETKLIRQVTGMETASILMIYTNYDAALEFVKCEKDIDFEQWLVERECIERI